MQFIIRILILLFLSSLCRLLFYAFNHQYFPSASLVDFIYGIRFDISMICWMSFPLILLSSLIAVKPISRPLAYITRYYFLAVVLLIICLNFTDMGFYLGLGGVSTFKNGGMDQVVPHLNRSKIILETDSPYLTPTPHRGKRNEPAYVSLVAGKVAEYLGLTKEEVDDLTTANANTLFFPDKT